jgi:hypothetical protein
MFLRLICGDSCGMSLATRSRVEHKILCHRFPGRELIYHFAESPLNVEAALRRHVAIPQTRDRGYNFLLVNFRRLQYHDEVAACTSLADEGGDKGFEAVVPSG